MFALRTKQWDTGEDWECHHSPTLEELCSRVEGGEMRTDRGTWCGCPEGNHHLEVQEDKTYKCIEAK
jgi:hypothetical protein